MDFSPSARPVRKMHLLLVGVRVGEVGVTGLPRIMIENATDRPLGSACRCSTSKPWRAGYSPWCEAAYAYRNGTELRLQMIPARRTAVPETP